MASRAVPGLIVLALILVVAGGLIQISPTRTNISLGSLLVWPHSV